jgi:hypothetical protein
VHHEDDVCRRSGVVSSAAADLIAADPNRAPLVICSRCQSNRSKCDASAPASITAVILFLAPEMMA